MTADSGYIKCWFDGPAEVMVSFRKIAKTTDRQNLFSRGLSWLDELDCEDEVESESVSYDTISSTQAFLTELLRILPDLQFEGTLEHSWPVLPCKQTVVTFSAADGILQWEERCEELSLDLDDFECFSDEDDEEIEIPLTPYD